VVSGATPWRATTAAIIKSRPVRVDNGADIADDEGIKWPLKIRDKQLPIRTAPFGLADELIGLTTLPKALLQNGDLSPSPRHGDQCIFKIGFHLSRFFFNFSAPARR
jgi:hypothetical protein